MSWILCFLLLSSATIFFSVFFNKRFEESFPLVTFSIILLLYVFGLVDKLEPGLIFVVVLIAITAISGIVISIIKNKGHETIINTFTPAFFIFAFLSMLIWYLNNGMLLSGWDEFSHWGRVAKTTYITDKISTFTDRELMFRSYPPAMSLWQYFILFFRGSWNESDLYRSYTILGLILFLPFLKNIEWKNSKSIVSTILLIVLTPLLFYYDYYTSIYIDPILALFFGYCLAEIYLHKSTDKISQFRIYLALAVLSILKESGYYLAFIACIVFAYKMIKQRTPIIATKRYANFLNFSVLLIPLLSNGLWDLNLYLTKTQQIFSGKIDWVVVYNVFTGITNDFRNVILSNFIASLSSLNLTSSGFALSFFAWSAILVILLYSIGLVDRENSNINNKTTSIIVVGLFTYTFGLLLAYWFKFSEYEATNLASFQRYISTYLQAVISFIAMVYIACTCTCERDNTMQPKLFKTALVVLLVISIPLSRVTSIFLHKKVEEAAAIRSNYSIIVNKFNSMNIENDNKIWIISEHTTGFDYWVFAV